MSDLRAINEQELKNILDKHGKWLRNEENGECANLTSANLRYANLTSANLRYANLTSANLTSADLTSANLTSANLRYANLTSANLVLFQFQKHQAFYTLDGTLRIGCHAMPITEWALGFKEIGAKEGYDEKQIKAYGQFIGMCLKMFKEQ